MRFIQMSDQQRKQMHLKSGIKIHVIKLILIGWYVSSNQVEELFDRLVAENYMNEDDLTIIQAIPLWELNDMMKDANIHQSYINRIMDALISKECTILYDLKGRLIEK